MRNPTEANLGPHRRLEFRPGVLLFPQKTPTLPPASYTNCYVLGTQQTVLVDPGSPYEEEIDRLFQALEALRSNEGRRVGAIWLTHHHPDHVGGVQELRRRFGLPVCAHPATAARLAEMGIAVDQELGDAQRVLLAGPKEFPVQIIHTPGHAQGHLCFYDETHGSLLAGDLVAGVGTIVVDPPEGNMGDYLSSLRRIRELAPQTLFPAHGPTTVDARGKLDALIEHRLWREQRILEAWKSGLREPAELRAQVYEEIPSIAHPLAERQVVAHLQHLEEADRLVDRRS
jgi:glyoxylase-like metal-dependent hydrolase (beta-lactamase superfamily II)